MKRINKLTKKTVFGLMFILSLATQSCSSKPNEKDLKSDLELQISLESNSSIKLTDLEKINSVDEEVFGKEVHTIFYKAKIEFTRDCYLFLNRHRGPLLINFRTYDEKPDITPGGIGHVLSEADKGDVLDFEGKATYVNTENGWVRQVESGF